MDWIDFKALREQLDFAQVLAHYHVEFKNKKGAQHQGFCPLPTHDGQKRSPSFSVNLERRIWQCFSCGAKGNVLDFACRMEGLNPDNGDDVRRTALKLQKQFGLAPPKTPDKAAPGQSPQSRQSVEAIAPVVQKGAKPSNARLPIVNAPLDFQLKRLDPEHPYLRERGFTPETIAHFGLGYCARGAFQGRIAIPLHDAAGQLIGYAGRLVDDSQIDQQRPKYKLPAPRLRNDHVYELHKSLFLYNGHRVTAPVSNLIIVEGFPSVWWLTQHGFPYVVALMGSSSSVEQAELIARLVRPDGHAWILTDGDEAGEQCAQDLFLDLGPHRFCRWVKLAEGQPTDRTPRELAELLWPV